MSYNASDNWLRLLDSEPIVLNGGDWRHSWFDARMKRVFNSGDTWSGRAQFIEVFNKYNPEVALQVYSVFNDGDPMKCVDPAISHLALTSNQRLVEIESFSHDTLFWYITLRSTVSSMSSFTLTDILVGENNG